MAKMDAEKMAFALKVKLQPLFTALSNDVATLRTAIDDLAAAMEQTVNEKPALDLPQGDEIICPCGEKFTTYSAYKTHLKEAHA